MALLFIQRFPVCIFHRKTFLSKRSIVHNFIHSQKNKVDRTFLGKNRMYLRRINTGEFVELRLNIVKFFIILYHM